MTTFEGYGCRPVREAVNHAAEHGQARVRLLSGHELAQIQRWALLRGYRTGIKVRTRQADGSVEIEVDCPCHRRKEGKVNG